MVNLNAPTNSRIHNELYDNWSHLYKNVKAPDSFIDFGFYFTISAALQRRVWLGDPDHPIFPNLYIILVGEPGVGKGLTIKPIVQMLRYHKLNSLKTGLDENLFTKTLECGSLTDDDRKAVREAQEILENSPQQQKLGDEPLLYPMSPESITYEALTRCMAKNIRKIEVPVERRTRIVPPTGIYTHNSLIIALEELSSLFKKKAEKIIDFLLVTYDCGQYTNETKTQGIDIIKRTCLSLIAGTTPSFLQDSYNEKLLNEGFSARTVFVVEDKNRFNQFGMPAKDIDQLESYLKILGHLFKLQKIFGQVEFSADAFQYMKDYFESYQPRHKINNNMRLFPYYAKKDLIAQKLAMAIHFSRSFSMQVQLDECEEAIRILNAIEPRMHVALQSGGRTPLGSASKKILRILKYSKEPITKYQLWVELEAEVADTQLEELLINLLMGGLIEKTDDNPVKYKHAVTTAEEILV